MLVLLLLSGVIVEAFVDYEFKVIAHQAFDSKDRLTSFFGTIASYGGLLALFVQTLITSRLLKRFGVTAAILLLPSALLAGFVLVAVRPALWAVSILKLIDGCLSYSVHRSGMELLFVPIPARLRASVKALIDLLVDRAGRAAGGVLLFALTTGLAFAVPSLSVVAACALVMWIAIAVAIRRHYVHAFRVALEKKVIEPEALGDQPLDSTISRALLQALSSSDDRQVLYALDLLASGHPSRWRQYLPALLEHRTPAIRSRTIAVLTDWRSFHPAYVEKRLLDEDLEVRIEAIRHLCEAGNQPTREKLREFLDHPDYKLVLAAIHCIARYRSADGDMIDEQLIEKALTVSGEHGVSAKMAAARGIAIARPPRATQFLEELLQDSSLEVVRQAVRASGEIGFEGSIPRLIPMLARARLRRDAREALLKLGAPALGELRARFQDETTPIEVRFRIPKVLSLSREQDAADFLFESIRHFTPRLDTALLKGLNTMRTESAGIRFDRERVSSLIVLEHERYQRLSAIRRAIQHGQSDGMENPSAEILALLDKALSERLGESVERVFRLLHLIYSPSDIQSAYFSFNERPALRASAVEFLDNLIDPTLRALVVPLVEDSDKSELEKESKLEEMSRAEAIQMLLAKDDEWLSTIASELVGRRRDEERRALLRS
jgi:HEAT repeat protein